MENILEPKFPTTRFSIRWIKSQCRPNMMLHTDDVIISILETGLLFREDSLQIEDVLQIENASRGRTKKRKFAIPQLTSGEKLLSVVAVGVCVALIPMKFPLNNKSNLVKTLCWAGTGLSVPILHRWLIPNSLPTLLQCLSEYTTLVRKCLACIKEQSIHSRSHWNVSIDAINSLLLQQHKEQCLLLNNVITTLQNVCPWLSSTYHMWEEAFEVTPIINTESLMKLHHLYLILQSTFLKSIALIHFNPPSYALRLNKNHNEKIYWIHSTLLPHVLEPTQDFLVALNNAYGYFKDHVNREILHKTLPKISREPWQYSEVHASIILCSSEIRSALIKANEMDTFLEACWNAKSKFSPAILEEDLSKLREDLVKCFATVDNTAVQLKKIKMAEMKLLEQAVQKLHLPAVEEEDVDVEKCNVKSVSEDTEINIKDQVFYFEKIDDEKVDMRAEDCITGPGKAEIQATKVVLGELKRKLVKREDEMRQREAIALEDTMPEYKGKIPNFPRQITLENSEENDKNDIIDSKSSEDLISNEKRFFNEKTNGSKHISDTLGSSDVLNVSAFENENDTNYDNQPKSIDNENYVKLRSFNNTKSSSKSKDSILYDSQSPSTSSANNKTDVERLTDDSDFSDYEDSEKLKLLKDVRKNRVTRKKNYPPNANSDRKNSNETNKTNQSSIDDSANNQNDVQDEGLEPMEYRFGTGMAIASLLHISRPENDNCLQNVEEVFAGDGEVSDDSGNET